ncbi:MAG: RecX family transcriptional regulator [Lachnospiraceae bacterium]
MNDNGRKIKMQITQITEIDKKRIRIELEDARVFVLYKGEARGRNLKEGEELSPEAYESIQKEILVKRACKRVMFLLEKMNRTESQLRDKLRQGFYQEEVIDQAIEYVKGYHYVDDSRYAMNYVRYQKERKSKRQIEMELRKKGIEKAVITVALEEEYAEQNEETLILKWVEKKHYSKESSDCKEKQKISIFNAERFSV